MNAVLFQAAWLTCVLGAIQFAVVAFAVFMCIHFYVIDDRKGELKFILCAGAAGFAIDLILDRFGILNVNPSGAFPLYLLFLWLLFCSTLRWSMKFFLDSPVLAGLLGFLAPVSYYAAQQFEKVKYSEPLAKSIAIHALLWAVFMLIVHYKVNKNEEYELNAG